MSFFKTIPGRILIVAFALAVLFLALIIVLDRSGGQPQPFQYFLH